MPISPARQAAFTILRRVDSGREFAVTLMQGPKFSALPEADRALGTELVMGVLRRQGELDQEIERLCGQPVKSLDSEVAIALRLGIYQMLCLDRIPHSAAVNESVEMVKRARKRSAAGMVNAVLRKFAAARGVPPAGHVNLPPWIFERWVKNFGEGAARQIAAASQSRPASCLRVCDPADSLETLQKELGEDGVSVRRGRFAPRALVAESGNLRKARAWQEGRVVIQDEGSQLVAELLKPQPGMRVLDVCAAPGMKMIQVAGTLGKGTILACDANASRLETLKRLAEKHIPPTVSLEVLCLDATREPIPGVPFDAILVDAPCTGTGTLARNPEIKLRLTPQDLTRLHGVQTHLLRTALAALAPRGRLVYSTCSLEPEENEQVVGEVLESFRQFRLMTAPELQAEFPSLTQFFDAPGYFRTRPGHAGMDGFFAAVIVGLL